jgi:1-acyl-sn-glycerol-3-phosphate acyltransferase
MSNHQSHLDIPVLYRVVRGRMRMVTKVELTRVPVWGRAMREAGMVVVDRGDSKQAIASLRAAIEQIRGGTSVWIAPEGTRTRTGALLPFKKGGFRLALDAGVPILPIAIAGTRDAMPADGFRCVRGKRVDVWVGAPIAVAGLTTEALSARVRAFLEEKLSSGTSRPDAQARRG